MSAKKEFEFKYNGGDTIDLNTLLTSQFHFLATINEIQKELYPDAKVNLRVAGFKPGSFVVQLVIETNFIQDLLTKENAAVLTGILTGFKGVIDVYKLLKGKKAISEIASKEDGKVEIKVQGNNNTVTFDKVVFNIYRNNKTANDSINKNFELLDSDPNIEGIEILEPNKKKPLIKVPRIEFENLTQPNEYFTSDKIEHFESDQIFFIKKANLMPEKNKPWKWHLIHKGRDIESKITDNNFRIMIDDGLKIGQGDRLIADINIEQKFDKKFNTFVETGRYNIIKVHKIIERDTQKKFELN